MPERTTHTQTKVQNDETEESVPEFFDQQHCNYETSQNKHDEGRWLRFASAAISNYVRDAKG